jgi:hypothetical protein
MGVLDASTSPPKERYAVSKDNIIKLIQPGNVDDPLTEILRTGARALLAQAVEADAGTGSISTALFRGAFASGPGGRGPLRPIVASPHSCGAARTTHGSASDSNASSSACLVAANGLTTVTPPQVKPSCMSSDKRSRQPACDDADKITASQIPNW